LSRELATENNLKTDWTAYIDELMPVIETVSPASDYELSLIRETAKRISKGFSADYNRVAEIDDLLFGEDVAAYGERCATVFSRWEEDEGGGPSLLSLLVRAWEHFGLPDDDALVKAGVISSILAEIPNELQFHGNEHYRKVLFHVIRMIKTQNVLHKDDEWTLNREEISILMIAGTIHDLGHEGGDNMRDGIYTPGYMEQKAIDIAMPYYEAVGMKDENRKVLETLVFCTDITFFAGDNSPCFRMRKIYEYYFVDQSNDSVLDYMMGKLRPFDDNPKVSLIAMMLHEADIGTSAGLTYERSIIETINIMEERFVQTAGPRVLMAFLQEQLEGSMKTESGAALFGPGMEIIKEDAMQDFQSGRETYYD
jgi:hypothetical protein